MELQPSEHLVRVCPSVAPLRRLAEMAANAADAQEAAVLLLPQACAGITGLPEPPAPQDAAEARRAMTTGRPVAHETALTVPLPRGSVRLAGPGSPGVVRVRSAAARRWTPDQVAGVEALAAVVADHVALRSDLASRGQTAVRSELAMDAAGVGTFDWDVDADLIEWDGRLEAVFGYDPGTAPARIAGFFHRVHAEDRDAVRAALANAVDTRGTFMAEYRIVLRDGAVRWVAARGGVLAPPHGRQRHLVGAAHDITARRTSKDEAERVLESMAMGYLSVDQGWSLTYLNAEGERILGRCRTEVLGRPLWEVFPGAEDLESGRRFHKAMTTGHQEELEEHYPHLDAWFELRAVPRPHGLGVYFLDITARRQAQVKAEAATARAELLSTVSARVAATLDPLAMVAELPRLVVPALGDWCIVTMREENGRLRDLGSWHGDERMRPLVERYAALRGQALRTSSYVHRALTTGQPVTIPRDATAAICEVLREGPALETLRELAPEQVVLLPLHAHGRITGLLNVFNGPGRELFDPVNVSTLTEVAQRASVALDNARLYAQQRSLAEGLQRGLLTAPPPIAGLEVAVRYQPAAEAAQVGGDWYDVFVQPDGHTVLVIGDVVGHDTEAAAAMAQVRGLLRGIGYRAGGTPAAVLTGLDETMRGLHVDTTATAVVARLESAEDQADGTTRLRWSNAGHPPPMVVTPDGRVVVLSPDPPDLLLGIRPSALRMDYEQLLPVGATVLLYTDGLVERRHQPLDDGLALLAAALHDVAHLPLEELCDGLLHRLLPAHPEDDVALVAVRLRE